MSTILGILVCLGLMSQPTIVPNTIAATFAAQSGGVIVDQSGCYYQASAQVERTCLLVGGFLDELGVAHYIGTANTSAFDPRDVARIEYKAR